MVGVMDEPVSPPPSKRRRIRKDEKDSEVCEMSDGNITVFSWNVNGIAPFIQRSITSFFPPDTRKGLAQDLPKASLRDFLRRHRWPTLLFLQEVKINPDDSATIRAVQHAVKKQPTELQGAFDYEAHFCLPNDDYNARGFGRKVYGVCSIVRADFKTRFVEKIRHVGWDKEGRFLVIETKGTEGFPKLAFINVYAVNGTDHPYKDPETGNVVGTRHDRKLQVHALLQKECRMLEASGFHVVLAGDLNIARAPQDGFPNLRTFPKQHCLNRADFEAKFFSPSSTQALAQNASASEHANEAVNAGLDMIDTFRHLHPNERCYTFYPRSCPFGESCDRVDMTIISRTLNEHLVEAGMLETPGERGPSDHVPLYACLKPKNVLGGD